MIIQRNMKIFESKRIIYVRTPVTDHPTKVYDWGSYYEQGTFEYYQLFRSAAKINTFKSLKWHLLVLWYLNPHLTPDDFGTLAEQIVYKENGFVTFNIKSYQLDIVVQDIYMTDLEFPIKNRARKIIFNWDCGLTKQEKLSICGQIIGKTKKVTPDDVYDVMLQLHDNDKKITSKLISETLGCSRKTVTRSLTEELKREKILLNNQLKTN